MPFIPASVRIDRKLERATGRMMGDVAALSLAGLVDLCSFPLKTVVPGAADLPLTERHGTIEVGYLNPIHPSPIQVVGHREMAYLQRQPQQALEAVLAQLHSPQHTVAVIVADDIQPLDDMINAAQSAGTALLCSSQPAQELLPVLQKILAERFTPNMLLHGVMMAVYGLGVLITGRSGIGKSELGLELLSRNHRLIADDSVHIKRLANEELVASCPERLRGHLEVRGLGILNIPEMFGYASVITERPLQLIVNLQRANNEKSMDRLQINREHQEILGLKVPRVSLNIAPGRNLAVLVEAAARDNILRMRGRNASARFVDEQLRAIKNNEK